MLKFIHTTVIICDDVHNQINVDVQIHVYDHAHIPICIHVHRHAHDHYVVTNLSVGSKIPNVDRMVDPTAHNTTNVGITASSMSSANGQS